MASRIFINYRREDSIGTAGRLYDRLAQTFGRKSLFMDVDHIPAGVDFVSYLNSQVAICEVFLAVIGPHWLDAKDELGNRRLDNPEDFVSIEIAAALNREIRVIPVLVDGAQMPTAANLPTRLMPLARRNAVEIRNAQFGRDAEALVRHVRLAFKGQQTQYQPATLIGLGLLLVAILIILFQTGIPEWMTRPTRPIPTNTAEQVARQKADVETQRRQEESRRKAQDEAARAAQEKTQEDARRKAAEDDTRRREAELAARKAEDEARRKAQARSAALQLSPGADPQNTLVVDTTQGRIVIKLRYDIAPQHAARLKQLARDGFYNGVPFHRVIAGFMAQTGDGQNGNGTGGSNYPDLRAEFSNVPFKRGTVGMARKGNSNDSANSQWFICYADASLLNGLYTVVGEVLSGMDVVDKIKKGEPVQNPDKMVTVQIAADVK